MAFGNEQDLDIGPEGLETNALSDEEAGGFVNEDVPLIEQRFLYDNAEDKVVVQTFEDVGRSLAYNRQLQKDIDGYNQARDWRWVARIPGIVVHMWMKEGINVYHIQDWPKVAQRLQDPAWRWLRTSTGGLLDKPVREFLRASSGRGRIVH